jgi:hypothetical protein
VQAALGPTVLVEPEPRTEAPRSEIGAVIRAAAADSAYRRFRGHLLSEERPGAVEVGTMVLVFGDAGTADRTFGLVAQAAHLRTELEGCNVAVETVAGPGGLVSYWGYVQRGTTIVVVTLDTPDPQRVSISDLRAIMSTVAARLHGRQDTQA